MTDFLSAVIRLSGVTLSRLELEERLERHVDRYKGNDAQIDIGDNWPAVDRCLRDIGEVVKLARGMGIIRAAILDVAFCFPDDLAAITRKIPPSIALLAGQNEIEIAVSIYLTATKD